ncbi:phage head-tail joining protein [Paracoccus sp. IB05]
MGEEQVTFRSLAEMRSLLAEMEASVAGSAGTGLQHYPQFVERP